MDIGNLIRQRVASDITSQFPGIYNLSIEQGARVLGNHPGHVRNQISTGEFPIGTVTIGSRRFIPLTSLVDYLAGLVVAQQKPAKPRRGRRTKAEIRLEREAQQGKGGGHRPGIKGAGQHYVGRTGPLDHALRNPRGIAHRHDARAKGCWIWLHNAR